MVVSPVLKENELMSKINFNDDDPIAEVSEMTGFHLVEVGYKEKKKEKERTWFDWFVIFLVLATAFQVGMLFATWLIFFVVIK